SVLLGPLTPRRPPRRPTTDRLFGNVADMAIEHVVVVGGGLMGSGIAQVVAQAGKSVTVVDVDDAALERANARIGRSLDRLVARDRLGAEDARATLARLSMSSGLEAAAAQADHVIETVVEVLDVKVDVLRRLDAACRDDVIFASNTSQFPISRLAAATGRPD